MAEGGIFRECPLPPPSTLWGEIDSTLSGSSAQAFVLYKGTGAKAHPASTLRPANNYSWLYLLLGGECPHKTESNRKERGNNQPRVT